jgi:methionine sulfoxide reductase heme-binding subunit
MATIAAASPSAYWFITRGSGVVTLILLTLTVALGVANVHRLQTAGVPRFVINAVHRNASLLAIVFLVIHVVTTVLDKYVNIRLIDAVVPFGAGYRPLWVGLGAIALDLMLAVVVTSLLRRHIGYRAWRATHWLAYACWPIALLHGIGTGTDAGTTWMQVVTGVCVAIVAAAVLSRVSQGEADRSRGTGDVDRVGGRAGDQHRTAMALRANPAGKAPVTDRQALAGHAAAVPVGERV